MGGAATVTPNLTQGPRGAKKDDNTSTTYFSPRTHRRKRKVIKEAYGDDLDAVEIDMLNQIQLPQWQLVELEGVWSLAEAGDKV